MQHSTSCTAALRPPTHLVHFRPALARDDAPPQTRQVQAVGCAGPHRPHLQAAGREERADLRRVGRRVGQLQARLCACMPVQSSGRGRGSTGHAEGKERGQWDERRGEKNAWSSGTPSSSVQMTVSSKSSSANLYCRTSARCSPGGRSLTSTRCGGRATLGCSGVDAGGGCGKMEGGS